MTKLDTHDQTDLLPVSRCCNPDLVLILPLYFPTYTANTTTPSL